MADLEITTVAPVSGDFEDKFTAPALEAIEGGQYVTLDPETGKVRLGSGAAAGTAVATGGIALRSVGAGEAVTVVRQGVLDVGDALEGLDFDAPVYLSDTDGTLADDAGTVGLVVGTVVPGWGNVVADKLLRVAPALV